MASGVVKDADGVESLHCAINSSETISRMVTAEGTRSVRRVELGSRGNRTD